jgi:hypothetical protein
MRRTSWLSLGTLVFGLGGAFACSSTPAAPYPNVQSFCTSLAQAECQVSSPCGTLLTTCEQTEAQNCEYAATAASTNGRTYNQANAKTCIDLATTTYGKTNAGTASNPLITATALSDLETTCEDVFAGTVTDGNACSSDYDCASSSSICTLGLCGPKTPVAVNTFCANPGDQCTSSYCAQSGATYKCLPLIADGQPCIGSGDCVDRCVNGLCEPLAGSGAACTTSTDCSVSTGFCDPYEGNICDEGENFGPTATLLCSNFGFGATVGATTTTPDAGGGTPDAGAD